MEIFANDTWHFYSSIECYVTQLNNQGVKFDHSTTLTNNYFERVKE